MTGDSSRYESFPSTQWSKILQIQGGDEEAKKLALAHWFASYWRPLCSYYRSLGHQWSDARDLAQGLMLCILEKEKLQQIDPHTSLRAWLQSMAKHYRIDEIRKARARRRMPPGGLIPIYEMENSSEAEIPIVDPDDPERSFIASWRKEVLDKSFALAKSKCTTPDELRDFEIFHRYYIAPAEIDETEETRVQPTWSDVADAHGLTSAKEAERRAQWVKRQLRNALRTVIREYLGSDDDVETEVRYLLQ